MDKDRSKMIGLLPFLTGIIGLRDPHGKGHSSHFRDLSAAFGRHLDMNSAQIETLSFAAEIHDIGKIAINEFIINKPGRFTEAEYLMVQHHSQLGANLTETIGLEQPIHKIILHHHENFDGSVILGSSKGNKSLWSHASYELPIRMTR